MILTFHIVIALVSLLVTGLAWVAPSLAKLRTAYGLVALTVASGTYLVATRPDHLAQACSVGLVYLGLMFTGIVVVRHKLARADGA